MKKLTFAVLGIGAVKQPILRQVQILIGGIQADAAGICHGGNFHFVGVFQLFGSIGCAQSHYLAFAAEKSRLLGGELLSMDEFVSSL